jgi:hypothetical protein
MTNEEHIEEILVEASSLNIRNEVLDKVSELKKSMASVRGGFRAHIDSASLYEKAFQEVLKEKDGES